MGGFAVSLYGAKYPDKKLRGIVTSGAAVCDTIGLFAGAPAGLDPNLQLPNELGGGVCSEGDRLVNPLQEIMNRDVYAGDKGPAVKILIATLGNDAGLLGAAALLM